MIDRKQKSKILIEVLIISFQKQVILAFIINGDNDLIQNLINSQFTAEYDSIMQPSTIQHSIFKERKILAKLDFCNVFGGHFNKVFRIQNLINTQLTA